MNVLLHYAVSPGLARQLARLPDWLAVRSCPELDDEGFLRMIREAETLWHVLRPVTAEHIAAAPKLRLIQKIGVGVNTIDLEAAKARGIAVCNMPGTNTAAVAEMTLMLMLAALRRAALFDRATREGRGWGLPPETFDCVGELAGRTVGLVGFGAVGQRLAPVIRALGARVLYTATSRKAGTAAEWRELPALLAEADVVSLHLPLNAATTRLLDADAIARMKAGAVLVNTARGGLVDEAALTAALAEGRLAAAGLDVFAEEPVDPANPLLSLDNVVAAPHVAWLTPETFARSLTVAVENCRRLRDNEPLLHQVA